MNVNMTIVSLLLVVVSIALIMCMFKTREHFTSTPTQITHCSPSCCTMDKNSGLSCDRGCICMKQEREYKSRCH